MRARTTTQTNACINNLRQIDGAKQQWALENSASSSAFVRSRDIQPYLGRGSAGSLPVCPADTKGTYDTSYTTGVVDVPPACRISSTNHVLL